MSILVKHFIKEPKIYLEIEKLGLTSEEKFSLTQSVTLLYHQKLLNKLLEYLEEEDKKIFLELLIVGGEENYLEFLHQKIMNLEEIVKNAVEEIEKHLLKDFRSLEESN